MLTGANKRRQLDPIGAALRVLERDGPAQVTTRAVAAEAGVTATALYRHFDDKDALIEALVSRVFQVFRDSMLGPAQTGSSLVTLSVSFDRYLTFALDHRNYYKLLFVEEHRIKIDRYPYDFFSGRSSTFRAFRDLVAQCMEEGMLRPDEPADVALTLYAHMHGLVMLHFAGRFADDRRVFEKFFHRSMEHVVAGLK